MDGFGLGLDVGAKRLGVAVANLGVRFARPLTTLIEPDNFVADIIGLVSEYDASLIVLGRPRGLQGQETDQTRRVSAFGVDLQAALDKAGLTTKLYWTDEALTSHQAEQELQARAKSYAKADVDALAATYILEDFLKENHG